MAELLKYEIAHDLLARQVFARFSAEEKTLRKAERMLGDSYELHMDLVETGDGSRLLNREELLFLRPYIKQIGPSTEILEYLDHSEEVASEAENAERLRLEAEIARQKEEQKRQKRWLTAAVGAGVVMLAIAIFAGISYKKANDGQIALTKSQDSLNIAFSNLEKTSKALATQTDLARKNEKDAIDAKKVSDEAKILAENSLLSLEEAQKVILAREKETLAAKERADQSRIEAEKQTEIANDKIATIGEAQGRELRKLENAIFQVDYDQGLKTILDATKFGTFNRDIRDGLLELAYYYKETGNSTLTDSLMQEVAFIDGTSRGGDENVTKMQSVEELAGTTLTQEWNSRYFPSLLAVDGGSFWMGETGDSLSQKNQKVSVNDFFISPYEITVYQYEMFLRAKGESINNLSTPFWGWEGHNPMVNVSWFDALRYCNWLSKKMGYDIVYDINGNDVGVNWEANGFRLPTEAEWEFAAGGGNEGRDANGYRKTHYSGSDNINSVAWYDDNSDILTGSTRAISVGQKVENELGLYDMSGNAWEWCFDWYGAYTSNNSENPKGLQAGSKRVARGGSWDFGAEVSRVDYRTRYSPTLKYDDLGFRIVRNR